MGLLSRNSTDDTDDHAYEDRLEITDVLDYAEEGDAFTLQTANGLILDFTVSSVRDDLLYGECEVQGPRFVRTSSGTVHECDGGEPASMGYGITRLEINEMATNPNDI